MQNHIQRIIIKSKPSKNNRLYNEWETASIVFFVDGSNMDLAVELSKKKIYEIKWEVLYYQLKDTLVNERINTAEKIIQDAVKTAKKDKIFHQIFFDVFAPGKKRIKHLAPPKVNEDFIEKVIIDAGGRRLTNEEKANEEKFNADFIIGNFIFEMKDLMEEGLEKKERKEKISNLFAPYYSTSEPIFIDPNILSVIDQKKYTSLISSPLEQRIKKAFKQTKATQKRISSHYKTGLIYLNSGYLSLHHDIFRSEIMRYIKKNKLSFDEIITFSVTAQSNGYDLYVEYFVDPKESSYDESIKILSSWDKNFENIMTKLVRGESVELSNPQKPISFNHDGIDFYWTPYAIERFKF